VREPVKVARAEAGGNGFWRGFREVGRKEKKHDAGGRITLTCPDVHRDWYFCVKVKVQEENIFNIGKSPLRSKQGRYFNHAYHTSAFLHAIPQPGVHTPSYNPVIPSGLEKNDNQPYLAPKP